MWQVSRVFLLTAASIGSLHGRLSSTVITVDHTDVSVAQGGVWLLKVLLRTMLDLGRCCWFQQRWLQIIVSSIPIMSPTESTIMVCIQQVSSSSSSSASSSCQLKVWREILRPDTEHAEFGLVSSSKCRLCTNHYWETQEVKAITRERQKS